MIALKVKINSLEGFKTLKQQFTLRFTLYFQEIEHTQITTTMIIETKLSQKNYRKLVLTLYYRNPMYIMFTIIGIIILIFSILEFIFMEETFSNPYQQLLTGLFLVLVMPLLTIYKANKNYNSNLRLNEPILYEFNNSTIKLTGESFNSEMTWEKVYKVKELKEWILIYQNKQVANLIKKSDFDTRFDRFKSIVLQTNVKNNLK